MLLLAAGAPQGNADEIYGDSRVRRIDATVARQWSCMCYLRGSDLGHARCGVQPWPRWTPGLSWETQSRLQFGRLAATQMAC